VHLGEENPVISLRPVCAFTNWGPNTLFSRTVRHRAPAWWSNRVTKDTSLQRLQFIMLIARETSRTVSVCVKRHLDMFPPDFTRGFCYQIWSQPPLIQPQPRSWFKRSWVRQIDTVSRSPNAHCADIASLRKLQWSLTTQVACGIDSSTRGKPRMRKTL
jgi:hypothetical protein